MIKKFIIKYNITPKIISIIPKIYPKTFSSFNVEQCKNIIYNIKTIMRLNCKLFPEVNDSTQTEKA